MISLLFSSAFRITARRLNLSSMAESIPHADTAITMKMGRMLFCSHGVMLRDFVVICDAIRGEKLFSVMLYLLSVVARNLSGSKKRGRFEKKHSYAFIHIFFHPCYRLY